MKFVPTATSWGIDLSDVSQWDSVFKKLRDDGYEAVEVVSLVLVENLEKLALVLDKYNLRCICQIHTSATLDGGAYTYCSSVDPQVHLNSLREQLQHTLVLPTAIVNVHSGHDSWDDEAAVDFFVRAMAIGDEVLGSNAPMVFETHRNRLLFNPWVTHRLLKRPELNGKLKLNADLSHWCVVGSRVYGTASSPADREIWNETIALVAEHAYLVHCRVGWQESAQVIDLDDKNPDIQQAIMSHLEWWQQIWEDQEKRGFKESFNETEFGPYPYLTLNPKNSQPIVPQVECNLKMLEIVRQRFESTISVSQ